MNTPKHRAWSWAKQGLDGSLAGASAAEVLGKTGWARSVGGANPYLGLFARAGIRREAVDADLQALHVHELPVVRGCTYLLGAEDFAWACSWASPRPRRRSRSWRSSASNPRNWTR